MQRQTFVAAVWVLQKWSWQKISKGNESRNINVWSCNVGATKIENQNKIKLRRKFDANWRDIYSLLRRIVDFVSKTIRDQILYIYSHCRKITLCRSVKVVSLEFRTWSPCQYHFDNSILLGEKIVSWVSRHLLPFRMSVSGTHLCRLQHVTYL